MADFEYISINTTAEKIERIANVDIDDVTLDENSTDNSLPTSKLVFDTIKNEVENKIDQTYKPESQNAQSGKAVAQALEGSVPKKRMLALGAPFSSVLAVDNHQVQTETGKDTDMPNIDSYHYIDVMSDGVYGKTEESVPDYRNTIPIRDGNGNLFTGSPKNDVDCANKKYVDDAIKNAGGGGTGGGTTDYEELDSKPKINGVELLGDKTASDLLLVDKETFDNTIGDIESALDNIIEIQEAYINGNYVNGVTLTDKSTSLNYKLYVDNEKLTMEVV